jgi:DNA-directed RNA polymerase specialized sigma24 family protein
LFYNDGLAYKEIAERLFLPVNTVKTYIYRAKKDLARELA